LEQILQGRTATQRLSATVANAVTSVNRTSPRCRVDTVLTDTEEVTRSKPRRRPTRGGHLAGLDDAVTETVVGRTTVTQYVLKRKVEAC